MNIIKKICRYTFCLFCKKLDSKTILSPSDFKLFENLRALELDKDNQHKLKQMYKLLFENGIIPTKYETETNKMLCEECFRKLNLILENEEDDQSLYISQWGCDKCISKFQLEAYEALKNDCHFTFDNTNLGWYNNPKINQWVFENRIKPQILKNIKLVEEYEQRNNSKTK